MKSMTYVTGFVMYNGCCRKYANWADFDKN